MKIFRIGEIDLTIFGLFSFISLIEIGLNTFGLFLPDENIHRHSVEIPFGTDFVFEETLVWFLYILRQVRKEQERRNTCLVQLHTVLYLDIFTLC